MTKKACCRQKTGQQQAIETEIKIAWLGSVTAFVFFTAAAGARFVASDHLLPDNRLYPLHLFTLSNSHSGALGGFLGFCELLLVVGTQATGLCASLSFSCLLLLLRAFHLILIG
jgi:hypothetical protein